ncbi:hypothetical protein Tco_1577635 [Tanacetum coccineum]
MANANPIVTTVTKPATNEKTPKDADATPRVNIQDLCEEHYEDILPVIMDKMRRDKRKEVHARLDFGESPKKRRKREGSQNSSARTLSARHHDRSERLKVQDSLRYNDRHMLDRLGHQRQSAFNRLSDTYSPSTTKSGPDKANSRGHSHDRSHPHRRDSSNKDCPRSKDCSHDAEESYGNSRSSYGTGTKHGYCSHDRNRSRYKKRERESESLLSRVSESGTSDGGHWKSKSKSASLRTKMTWRSLGYAKSSTSGTLGNAYMVSHVQFYLNSGRKSVVKDPVEIHNIKQKDGETMKDFMKRFKVETGRMKGAPECMRISGFMHGVNNPELTKSLNEHILKTMEEMMIATTAFIRGETAAAGKKKGHASWRA